MLLTICIFSLIINLFLFIRIIIYGIENKKTVNLFSDLLKESKKLEGLLSSSTSNLDKLIQMNINLHNQVTVLKESKDKLLNIGKGDKVITKSNLLLKTTNHSFDVLYECLVLEASEKHLKLSAFDFESDDKQANNNRNAILKYLNNKWVPRNDCEIIVEKKHLRDSKLNDLLNGIED